tara:strand:- start:1318 stop:1500 length:183 start_codon:yes stop_codon:yes gene_type:complete
MADKLCPRCKICYFNKEKGKHPAISRRDNKTEICSFCGTDEALFDFKHKAEMEWLEKQKI